MRAPYNRREAYFEIVRALLTRGGGGAIGHHTMHVHPLLRSIHTLKQDQLRDALERLIDKEDLLVHYRNGQGEFYEHASVSINPARIPQLREYLHDHPRFLNRLKEVEREYAIR